MARKRRKIQDMVSDEQTAITIYKLGYLEGENKLRVQINKLQAAHNHLAQELLRMDEEEPKVGVTLSYNTIKTVIRNVKKAGNYPLAKRLTKMAENAHLKDVNHLAEGIIGLLENKGMEFKL